MCASSLNAGNTTVTVRPPYIGSQAFLAGHASPAPGRTIAHGLRRNRGYAVAVMRTAVLAPPVTDTLDRDAFERAWHGVHGGDVATPTPATSAHLTISRNSPGDFQDRQVYVWVDDESWGKIKYGQPLSREIALGPHRIRVNNTLFNDTLTFTARPGEHVRVRCRNGMPRAGWLLLVFLHATYLRVKLEREA